MKGKTLFSLVSGSVMLAGQAFAQGYTFTSIDVSCPAAAAAAACPAGLAPGQAAASTGARGINARGDIVGFYTNADRIAHGFLLDRGTFTTIDVPGIIQLRGISATGLIVGSYSSAGVTHGFLLQQ